MRTLILLLLSLTAVVAHGADYAREKKWADEVVPSVVVGDAVYLETAGGHKFLTLLTEAPSAKGAVVVVHGMGVHPDWALIGVLRSQLADSGYTTLSVQMPVLAADAKGEAYPPTFPEAAERIGKAVEFLGAKGYRKIALVSHSMGARMARQYLAGQPDAPIAAWVSIGMGGTDDYRGIRPPVLDLYGDNDLPPVLKQAAKRGASLNPKTGSIQVKVAKADHFFNNRDAELVGPVRDFLAKILAP